MLAPSSFWSASVSLPAPSFRTSENSLVKFRRVVMMLQVGAERRRRGPQLQLRGIQLADRVVDVRAIVPEVLREVELQALTVGLHVLAHHRHRAGVGLVQLHRQVVASLPSTCCSVSEWPCLAGVGATHVEQRRPERREVATDLVCDVAADSTSAGAHGRRSSVRYARRVDAAADREVHAAGGAVRSTPVAVAVPPRPSE